MSDALAVRSLPPAVGELPTPEEITPGTYSIMTAREESVRLFHRGSIPIAVRTEPRQRLAHGTGVPRGISITLRALNRRDSGRWAALASETELYQELLSYVRLDENWDGNGAKAPSQEAVNDALTFLDGRPNDIPLPYPEEGTDGDVGIYWDFRNVQVFAEVTFEGDGTCAYFAVRGRPGAVAEKYGNDDVDVGGPWPEDILRILRFPYPA